ncbi:MAG TPA: DUF1749 domain-containing protein [Patescibacteria group bacterium]|nr:DUF1749 domain-containing protein [Patescibacteria group bacterium]
MKEPRLVEFKTEDKLTLPGLLYEATGSKKIAIFLHGNGSSSVFYGESKKRDLPEALNKKGISFLAFNNRGAHIIKKLSIDSSKKNRKSFGCAYEIIKECVWDIEAAVKFVKSLGYNEYYLIGTSTGANKICVYNHYNPGNEFSKYALVCGGDDTGGLYDILGDKLFFELLNKAKEMVDKGQGEDISIELIKFGEIFSYKAFYDIADPEGDYNCFPFSQALGRVSISKKPLFGYFKEIDKPSVVIYGENDEYAWGEVSKLVGMLKTLKPEFKYEIIKDANHGFDGKEKELAKAVADWL